MRKCILWDCEWWAYACDCVCVCLCLCVRVMASAHFTWLQSKCRFLDKLQIILIYNALVIWLRNAQTFNVSEWVVCCLKVLWTVIAWRNLRSMTCPFTWHHLRRSMRLKGRHYYTHLPQPHASIIIYHTLHGTTHSLTANQLSK